MPDVKLSPVGPAADIPKPLRTVRRDDIERPRLQWHGAFLDALMGTLNTDDARQYRATLVVMRFLEMARQHLYVSHPKLRLRTITNPDAETVSAWIERRPR